MKFIKAITMATLCLSIYAGPGNDHKKEEKTAEKSLLKKGGAVTAFNKDDGFKLSEKAKKNLGVSFLGLGKGASWDVPKSSIVRIKNSTGVYRKYDGWITLVLVDILKKKSSKVTIKSIDLQEGDGVAVTGVKFLRMTDADLNSDTVDACAH